MFQKSHVKTDKSFWGAFFQKGASFFFLEMSGKFTYI